jgi:hypothetical protein
MVDESLKISRTVCPRVTLMHTALTVPTIRVLLSLHSF